jgi:hypothetical protein
MGEHLALLASILWHLERPCPLPFGQRHFLKPALRPLKLADLIDLHNKGICFVRQATKPIPAGCSEFILRPLLLGHATDSFSSLPRV